MKNKKINPFDFRYSFTPALLIITLIGMLTHKDINPHIIPIYGLMTILFVACLHIGAIGIKKDAAKQLKSIPPKIEKKTLLRSRIIFIATQLYFIYLFSKILTIFASGGFSAFETLRTDLKENINSYIYIPLQFFCITSICYEIFHYNHIKRDSALLKKSPQKKERTFAVEMISLYFIETVALGSRSVIFIASIAFLFSFLRGSNRKISRTTILIVSTLTLLIFGLISFARLFSNPETFNWWVSQGYFQSFDFNEIGPITAATTMLSITFGDMVYRPMMVVESILRGNLEHSFGATSFFFWYSMLPGPQVDPGIFLNHNVFFSGTDAAIPATVISQLFWDFGWPGIFIGGTFVGLFGRLLGALSANKTSPMYTILYAMYFVQLMLGIYGAFNIGLLLFYVILAMLLMIFMDGKLK